MTFQNLIDYLNSYNVDLNQEVWLFMPLGKDDFIAGPLVNPEDNVNWDSDENIIWLEGKKEGTI